MWALNTVNIKLKEDQEFVWRGEQQLALDEIKNYLINPLVLIPPQQGKPFRLYLSTNGMVIGSALIHEFEGKKHVIYYLSRRLVDAETRYLAIQKLCLCLYFSCIKLRHYLLSAECTVICKDGCWHCQNLIYAMNRLRQSKGSLWPIL